MPRFQLLTTTLPLSGTVSPTVAIPGAVTVGVFVPVVTSGTLLVQGSPDTTSANFTRVQNAAGSGDFTLAVGPGSKAFFLGEAVVAFPYIRLESSVPQAAERTLTLAAKV